jgi:hypothetical protein
MAAPLRRHAGNGERDPVREERRPWMHELTPIASDFAGTSEGSVHQLVPVRNEAPASPEVPPYEPPKLNAA